VAAGGPGWAGARPLMFVQRPAEVVGERRCCRIPYRSEERSRDLEACPPHTPKLLGLCTSAVTYSPPHALASTSADVTGLNVALPLASMKLAVRVALSGVRPAPSQPESVKTTDAVIDRGGGALTSTLALRCRHRAQ